jgi:hypothetical protein
MPSTRAPLEVAPEEVRDRGGTVIGCPPLVGEETLGQQRSEHGAGKLGEDVDERIEWVDALVDRGGNRDDRVEMATGGGADPDHQGDQHEGVDEADDGVVGAELGGGSAGDVEDGDAGDEEGQEHGPHQLGDVCGETSVLHRQTSSIERVMLASSPTRRAPVYTRSFSTVEGPPSALRSP